MARKKQQVSATEFKAKCLALLDEIEQEGATITVTRRGRPVAVIGPVLPEKPKSPRNTWAGKIHFHTDIVNDDTSDLWDVVRD